MAGLQIPRSGGSFWQKGQQHSSTAINAYGAQGQNRKTEMNPPGHTAGGDLMAGAGGAAAGYSIGAAVGGGAATGSSAGPYGALIGAGIGLLGYYLS